MKQKNYGWTTLKCLLKINITSISRALDKSLSTREDWLVKTFLTGFAQPSSHGKGKVARCSHVTAWTHSFTRFFLSLLTVYIFKFVIFPHVDVLFTMRILLRKESKGIDFTRNQSSYSTLFIVFWKRCVCQVLMKLFRPFPIFCSVKLK